MDLVGNGSGSPPGTEQHLGAVTVRHHGALHGAAFDAVLGGANIAVSTLAFHRTGLREGAVLKTREYVARGLPIVLGYEDVDVPADLPFVLQVPNDDSLVPIDALFAFAERAARTPDLSAAMRAHPRVFSPFYVSVIRIGETTGSLDEAFLRMFERARLQPETLGFAIGGVD